MSILEQFLTLLASAEVEAVTVDEGPYLTHWETAPLTGSKENEILRFSWTDSDCDYSDIFTEGEIEEGYFDPDGTFHCGESTIRLFKMEQIKP